jgi:hypothetical protein
MGEIVVIGPKRMPWTPSPGGSSVVGNRPGQHSLLLGPGRCGIIDDLVVYRTGEDRSRRRQRVQSRGGR